MRPKLIATLAAAALAAAGSACAQSRVSAPTQGSVTVIDPAQVRQDADLAVPTVSRPAKGARTAKASDGSYTLTGLGGEAFAVSAPQSVVLTRQGGTEEIRLQIVPSQTVGAFAGPAGQPATAKVGVSGSLPVASDAKSGVYQGQYDVTVAYQ